MIRTTINTPAVLLPPLAASLAIPMLSPGRLRFECPVIEKNGLDVAARRFLSRFCPLTEFLRFMLAGVILCWMGQIKDSFRLYGRTGSEIMTDADPFARRTDQLRPPIR
jgi:hypothetical protein